MVIENNYEHNKRYSNLLHDTDHIMAFTYHAATETDKCYKPHSIYCYYPPTWYMITVTLRDITFKLMSISKYTGIYLSAYNTDYGLVYYKFYCWYFFIII